MQVITRVASTRVARYAFEYAKANNRKKVTAVHKANIMKKTDGLFIQCVREVSQDYPDIMHDEMIVDNTCMQVRALPFAIDCCLHMWRSPVSHGPWLRASWSCARR